MSSPQAGDERMHRWVKGGLYALALVLVLSALLEGYARAPSRVSVTLLNLNRNTRTVILLFHGRNGQHEPTLLALEQRFRGLAGGQPDTAVVKYLWAPHSDKRFRVGAHGERIGTELGRELAGLPQLEYLHLVAQSAGAQLVEPVCNAYRHSARRPARIEMTYLDPSGFGGAFDPWYGSRTYGRCADFAQAYISTDDPVPATNTPLRHAWNVDVTQSGERAGFSGHGHRWPMQYYVDHLSAAEITPGLRDHARYPRGTVERR